MAGGKFAVNHVPLNLRQIISAESAANDGLAYPFLTISIYLTVTASRSEAVVHWILIGWLCKYCYLCAPFHSHFSADQVILGVIIGAALGSRILNITWVSLLTLLMIQEWRFRI